MSEEIETKKAESANGMSDELLRRLLRATSQGDTEAFRALYESTSARLHAVALALLHDAALAEDALQDAFVQAWHRAGEYHADRGTVLTWLTTIVRYRAIDIVRKRAKSGLPGNTHPVNVDPMNLDYLQQGNNDNDDSGESGPLADAIASEENGLLRDCLDRLSNNQQRSVALAFFRGFTHQELADCLAEPLGTIKSRLRRSLARLKDCLQPNGEEYEIQRGAN